MKILFFLITALMISCVPQRQIEYLHTKEMSDKQVNLYKDMDSRLIRPGDELYIQVYSFSNNISSPVGAESSTMAVTPYSASLLSYKVDKDSSIIFPLIGRVAIAGLNIHHAELNLKSRLESYISHPSVKIKLVNTNISVMGEVSHPGNYTYTNTPLNIFQALSLAGDISEYGDRKHVRIIRNNDQNVGIGYIDLTTEDIIKSKYFYLEANDVIYVRPLKRRFWGVNRFPFEILISTASIIATLMITYKLY